MGAILSRFKRKKETTFQILESLENRIKKIEDFRRDTEQRQKTIVGHLIIYSVGIYVLAAIFFYFYYFPQHVKGKILCITPLLVFPIIVILIKRLVTWYFHRKITRNQELISEMKDEKIQLLENVKDNETYKVAKEILEKFAPDQLRRPMPIPSPSASRELLATGTSPGTPGSADLRRRPIGGGPPTNNVIQRPAIMGPPGSPAMSISSPPPQGQFPMQRGPPMPRPVLPRDRGTLDKLVEYLVGDGPSNRYALICRQCQSHNGMALKEEFEYLAFRCCYCYHWNPARKQRPTAPRLITSADQAEMVHTSGSELESNTDTTDDSGGEELLPKESHPSLEPNLVNGARIEEITQSPTGESTTTETHDAIAEDQSSREADVASAGDTKSDDPLATKSSSDLSHSDL